MNLTVTITWFHHPSITNLIVGVPPPGSPPRAWLAFFGVECDYKFQRISQYLEGRGIYVTSLVPSIVCSNKHKATRSYPPNDGDKRNREKSGFAQSPILQMQSLEPTIPLTSLLMSNQTTTHATSIDLFSKIWMPRLTHANDTAIPTNNRATNTTEQSTPNRRHKQI